MTFRLHLPSSVRRAIRIVTLVALGAVVVPLHAGATVFSYTQSGTIAAGQIDYNGIFGPGWGSLTGDRVSFTYSFDPSLATAGGSYLTYNYLQYTGGNPVAMTASVTIAGTTIIATSTGFSQITDSNSTGNPNLASTVDTAISFAVEDTVNTLDLRLNASTHFSLGDLTSLGLGPVDASQAQSFYVSDQGVGREESLYFIADTTQVSEPAGLALFGAGLLAVAGLRTRRRV